MMKPTPVRGWPKSWVRQVGLARAPALASWTRASAAVDPMSARITSLLAQGPFKGGPLSDKTRTRVTELIIDALGLDLQLIGRPAANCSCRVDLLLAVQSLASCSTGNATASASLSWSLSSPYAVLKLPACSPCCCSQRTITAS